MIWRAADVWQGAKIDVDDEFIMALVDYLDTNGDGDIDYAVRDVTIQHQTSIRLGVCAWTRFICGGTANVQNSREKRVAKHILHWHTCVV